MSIFSDIGNAISSVAKAVVPMVINAAFPEAALAASCTPSVCSGRYMRMRTGIASRGNGCMVNRR